jgi:uncharacterized protein
VAAITGLAEGDVVLLRSVYDRRVRWAFPHRFVDAGDRFGFYVGPGAPGVWMGRDADGRYLERWVRGDDPFPKVWSDHHVLRLVRPSAAHSVDLFWTEDWTFKWWYVNLQTPLGRTPLGFDTTDLALDLWVEPDGTPHWKDEDDFAEARALGVLDDESAAAMRAEGERVLEEWPFPTGWEDWRPDPDWPVPQLPARWAAM